MDSRQREALGSLHLSFAPTADEMWHSQGTLHVGGLHDAALGDVLAAVGDAQRAEDVSPLGVVVRGPAGSGKTHLLGQVRERVQEAGGTFVLVQLLDATSFWHSVRGGVLDSFGRPAPGHETQLRRVLWELASIAHVGRAARRAIVGDEELTPQVLDEFVTKLVTARRDPVRAARHCLRALVLLGAEDLALQDIGEAFLRSSDGIPAADRTAWGLPVPELTAQEVVRDLARLLALAGPTVLAIDQIDTLLAQSNRRTETDARATDNRDLEHVAHGLMAVRETMRRTVTVVACLPSVWVDIEERAVASVRDRFRTTEVLQGLPTPEIARAILERRFTASYDAVGFTPPYPSWPILPTAFDDASDFTPRGLLQAADQHVRRCLQRDQVAELASFTGDRTQPPTDPVDPPRPGDLAALDRAFAAYRRRAVPAAALDPDGEDTTMPPLLSAALQAWIVEHGGADGEFTVDPPPGKRVGLHARLRQSLDAATDDERHWAFRAIAAHNAIAAQNRIRKAWEATGAGRRHRQLFLLRNSPWPSGAKTTQLIADFEDAGGRTLPVADDDLRTLSALRDLLDEDHADLPEWLRARRPAHGVRLLHDALGDLAGDPPPPPVTEPEPEPEAPLAAEPAYPPVAEAATAVPLGVVEDDGRPLSVDLAQLRKHTVIFAGSGSGKTVLIRRLVEECALRGVSSIVLDANNDLARLGTPWPEPPAGWTAADDARAAEYFAHTEVVVWTPGRNAGRQLSFQPLPDFGAVVDDRDEFDDAVESALAALEPRALISGKTAKAELSRAVLREALEFYGRQPAPTLRGFVDLLGDLPPDVSGLAGATRLAAELSENLRAAMVNDPLFGGHGTPVDPAALLTPSDGRRARVSVVNLAGLPTDAQREGFVNQLQMALFAWIKRHPAGDRPLGGLLVMDEAQNFAPSGRRTVCLHSTLALSSQARKYGLGLVYATQAPKGLNPGIPGNAATQLFGLLNAPVQITVAREMARVKGGRVPDISRLRAGQFYAALEGTAFAKIRAPWCLSHHPASPPPLEDVLALARA
ncbi:DUF87 domain-containing protein [Mycobacterium sp. MYCO198283]|uniref:helicase HerA domain-containing protein n=1 Tax=Mycobacterium sp. MYCO198283 TaxID=2883505 RepID=UPI001E5CF2A1|nr:DUF87 domain-containing protein [Mycobacterium sp. MYCO198283]MCG5433218.1 DUF87 domain-containing protein [Mycobacterium sp. MYCO198283]